MRKNNKQITGRRRRRRRRLVGEVRIISAAREPAASRYGGAVLMPLPPRNIINYDTTTYV